MSTYAKHWNVTNPYKSHHFHFFAQRLEHLNTVSSRGNTIIVGDSRLTGCRHIGQI